ncbi:MAG: zinc-binding dehydrogenase [Myxococcota bacterium]
MSVRARVVVLPKNPGPLEVQELRLPDPGAHQVVVKQFASGVCHSQLHQMHAPRETPVILGHESTGVVLARGREVKHVREGDKVFVTWVPRDKPHSPRFAEPAMLALAGGSVAVSQNVYTWADHTVADEQYVVKVRPDAPTDVTAIIGCAVMTGAGAVLNTAAVKRGESVAIFGAGGVGLSAVAAAREVGADPVIVVDLDDAKLEFARRFGATITLNASRVDAVAEIHRLTPRAGELTMFGTPVSGVDHAFDCIGVTKTMQQILAACRTANFGWKGGGNAVLVGVPTSDLTMPPIDLLLHEKRFIGSIGGSCQPDRDFPIFLDWHTSRKLDLDALVTERFPIEKINEATHALVTGRIFGRAILEFA